jgi:nicotinamide mononucleotide transporter
VSKLSKPIDVLHARFKDLRTKTFGKIKLHVIYVRKEWEFYIFSLYFRNMNWSEILQYIAHEWHLVTWLEIIAVVFSIAEVLLSYKNNILLYPAGIISSALYIFLLFESKLYADTGLTCYYLLVSIWGWINWAKRRADSDHLHISKASANDWLIVALISVGGSAFIFAVLKYYTDSTVPIMDAIVSATAWAGTWLLTKRKVENWIVLNVSNIVAIPLLYYKDRPLTALLTLFLFIVAVLGYFRWMKIMEQERASVEFTEFDIQIKHTV